MVVVQRLERTARFSQKRRRQRKGFRSLRRPRPGPRMAGGDEAMRSVLSRACGPAVAGTLLCALAGCGGDSARPLVLSQRGKLDITVDWTSPDTWMYVYFGGQKCDYNQLAGQTCPFILSSETKDPKPRVLYTDNLDPGTYYLFLYNVPKNPRLGIGSDNTEAVSIQVGLTVGAEGRRPPDVVHLGRPTVVTPPHL
jgi:hypothetical protein